MGYLRFLSNKGAAGLRAAVWQALCVELLEFGLMEFNFDAGRLKKGVVNEAQMHAAHEPLILLLRERHGAVHSDVEVVESRGLEELFRVDGDFDGLVPEKIAGLEVLDGIKRGAGAEGSQQELGRGDAGVFSTVVGRLITDDGMIASLNLKANLIKMSDFDFHMNLQPS